MLLTIGVFALILSFLVFIHEAGHFWAARKFGVKVDEFGFGYPPLAKKLFRRNGTDFTLNWLPFGGFVRLAGEERYLEDESKAGKGEGQMFYAQKKWKRIVIILAGAMVNFIFGLLAFSFIFSVEGIPEEKPLTDRTLIIAVFENSPAKRADLRAGDMVLAIKDVDEPDQLLETAEINEMVEFLDNQRGEEVELLISREEVELRKEMYVRTREETSAGQGALGIQIAGSEVVYQKYPVWQMPFRGAWTGTQAAVNFGLMIVKSLGQMVADGIGAGQLPEEVAGPVGIVYVAQKQGIIQEGFLGILNFAAVLSINLAIVNVLPVPALDGGRAMFIFLEKIMGKRFKPEYERYANMIGFALLLLMIILVSARDIQYVLRDVGLI